MHYVPELAKAYPAVTLRHFTTMTSGYCAAGDEPEQNQNSHGPSLTPFAPAKPLFTPAGSRFAYWDSAMNQFGNVLTRLAGEPLEQIFKGRIADPIGMNSKEWDWKDWGVTDEFVINGGAGNRSKGIHKSARKLARFGHLFLNNGRWNGRQSISEAWVKAATSTQISHSVALGHPSGSEGPGLYGYNW